MRATQSGCASARCALAALSNCVPSVHTTRVVPRSHSAEHASDSAKRQGNWVDKMCQSGEEKIVE